MPIIAKNARSKRKTETVVPKLLTWEVPRRTCFTNGKNTGSKRDSPGAILPSLLLPDENSGFCINNIQHFVVLVWCKGSRKYGAKIFSFHKGHDKCSQSFCTI